MLTTYMDESGIHDRDWCVVAGFLGTDDQWKNLAGQWKEGLQKHGKSSLHMKLLRWSKPHRFAPLLQTLGPIPANCGLTRIFGVLRLADYEDLLPDDPEVRITMSPYMMGATWCFSRTFANIPESERVNFVFERQDLYSRWKYLLESLFGMIYGSRLVIRYVGKDTTSLTQPADYLAFAIRYMQISPTSPRAQLTKSIVGDARGYGAQITREYVRESVAKVVQWVKGMKDHKEFNNFSQLMKQLISVPHGEIKSKLDAEKSTKKRKKSKKSSASGRA